MCPHSTVHYKNETLMHTRILVKPFHSVISGKTPNEKKLNSSCSSRPGIVFRLQGKYVIVTGGVWIGHDVIPCKSFLMETNTCHPPSPHEFYNTIHKTAVSVLFFPIHNTHRFEVSRAFFFERNEY